MPNRRDDDDMDREFDAGVLLGLAPSRGTRPSLTQADVVEQLRPVVMALAMDAIPPAIEEGVRRAEKRHATVLWIVVGSLVVTAVATAVIAVSTVTK